MIATRMRVLKQSHLRDIPLFDGVPAMLKSLKNAGIVLALVSSDSEANARLQLGPDNAALFTHFRLWCLTVRQGRKVFAGGQAGECFATTGDRHWR